MDRKPIKNPAVLIADLRERLQPSLLDAGFLFDRKYPDRWRGGPTSVDYRRGDAVFSLHWNARSGDLVAEYMTGGADVQRIACVSIRGVEANAELMGRVHPLLHKVTVFLAEFRTGD
jgi:hypothetical protein